MNHLLSIEQLSGAEIEQLVTLAVELKKNRKASDLGTHLQQVIHTHSRQL